MKKYELLLVLPGTLDENEAESKSNEVLAIVKEKDGNAELNNLGKTRLAYPIKQIRYGYFYTVSFSVEVEALKALQEKFRLMPELLRTAITEFNAGYNPNQKLSFVTNEIGSNNVTNSEEVEEVVTEKVEEKKPEEKVSMQEIDKKLDEILAGDVIPGV